MDHSGKKLAIGIGYSRARSSVRLSDPCHNTRNVQNCSRSGCSSRYNTTSPENAEKVRSSRTAFHSSAKPMVGGSFKIAPPISLKKVKEKKNSPSTSKRVICKGSRPEDPIEESGSGCSLINPNMDNPDNLESGIFRRFPANADGSSCSRTAYSETRSLSVRRIRSAPQEVSFGSSIYHPVASQNPKQSVGLPQVPHADPKRYGLRSLSCRSITDVLESRYSSSTSRSNRTDTSRRKYPTAEGSHKVTAEPLLRETSTSARATTMPSPSITRRPCTQTPLLRARNRSTSRGSVPPARTPGNSHGRENQARFIEIGDDMFSLPEPLLIAQEPQLQSLVGGSMVTRSLLPAFTEAAPVHPVNSNGTGQSTYNARNRHAIHIMDRSSPIEFQPFMDTNSHRHFNMDGVAEMLLALDRIDQDEALSYEQLMMLETNLLSGGFSIYDQHRDLRLDIDNMSYEELLALGERMGTVNTSLSEVEMSKCLSRSIIKSSLNSIGSAGSGDDAKCSICQEEYIPGDEVGKLVCEHFYHMGCIGQWFKLKNWCPICKAPALPSSDRMTTY